MFKALYKKTALWPYLLIAVCVSVSTIILWLPFLLKVPHLNGIDTQNISFQTVLSHWDGPLYIIPAKTGYDPEDYILSKSPLGLSPKYFAAHLPGYPTTIAVFSKIIGYPKATILSTLFFTVILYSFFYFFLQKLNFFKSDKSPVNIKAITLTAVFLFFTPRLFVVRSVGSPEPMFMLFILSSIYFFVKKKYLVSSILGSAAIITKTPAILLFLAYSLFFVDSYRMNKKFEIKWLSVLLIPISLIAVFIFYFLQYGDFFAYFNSGDNLHLFFPPFSVFNFQKNWVTTGWLEEIVFVYLFYLFTLFTLWEKIKVRVENEQQKHFYKVSFYFALVFFISIISVQHRDIARYSLPLLPLALIVLSDFFTSKKFIFTLILLLPAIYLYAWNFMMTNTAPISDWSLFL